MMDYFAQNWESLFGSLVVIAGLSGAWYFKYHSRPPLSGIAAGLLVAVILTLL